MTVAEETVLSVTEEQLACLLSLSATFTLIEDAVQNLSDVPLDDDEIAVLRLLPEMFRMRLTARLVEVGEVLREAMREFDGRLLELTGGRTVDTGRC